MQGPFEKTGWPSNNASETAEAEVEDPEAIAQAHVNAISGACLAMGIRFAGTGNNAATSTLLKYVEAYLKMKMQAPDPFTGRPLSYRLQTCISYGCNWMDISWMGFVCD